MTESQLQRQFADHRVTNYDRLGEQMETLTFMGPSGWIDGIKFIRDHHILIVVGDLGDAIYQWQEIKPLSWMANLDLDYFRSKCRASPVGSLFKSWDAEKAKRMARVLFADQWEQFTKSRGLESLDSRHEWIDWLEVYGDDLFGDDWTEYADIGMDTDSLCRQQHFALHLAMERLALKNQVPA